MFLLNASVSSALYFCTLKIYFHAGYFLFISKISVELLISHSRKLYARRYISQSVSNAGKTEKSDSVGELFKKLQELISSTDKVKLIISISDLSNCSHFGNISTTVSEAILPTKTLYYLLSVQKVLFLFMIRNQVGCAGPHDSLLSCPAVQSVRILPR